MEKEKIIQICNALSEEEYDVVALTNKGNIYQGFWKRVANEKNGEKKYYSKFVWEKLELPKMD